MGLVGWSNHCVLIDFYGDWFASKIVVEYCGWYLRECNEGRPFHIFGSKSAVRSLVPVKRVDVCCGRHPSIEDDRASRLKCFDLSQGSKNEAAKIERYHCVWNCE